MASFRDVGKPGQLQQPQGQKDPNVPADDPKGRPEVNQRKSFRNFKPKDNQSKPLPKFTFGPDKSLSLSFEIMNQGLAYQNAQEVINSEAMKLLMPLIKPLCKLANAAVHQSISAMKSPGNAKMRDANGKLTKQLDLDEDGKPKPLPSALEVAKNAYTQLLKDPNVKNILDQLSTYFENKDKEEQTYDPNQGPGS